MAGPLGRSNSLPALGYPSRIEIIKTTGDKITDVPLAQVGAKGLFTKEIEEALLAGRGGSRGAQPQGSADRIAAGLVLAATPEREDPRDALVGKSLADLPAGAKLGTSSLRRAAQLRKVRPDLRIEAVRGNLDTRLRKLDEGQYDAIVLAAAGSEALGLGRTHRGDPVARDRLPGCGAGRAGDRNRAMRRACMAPQKLNAPTHQRAVTAERALLGALGGGCQVPIGAYATVDGDRL